MQKPRGRASDWCGDPREIRDAVRSPRVCVHSGTCLLVSDSLAMAGNDPAQYQYRTSNNTRAAAIRVVNSPTRKKKRKRNAAAIEPIPAHLPVPPKRKKHARNKFESALADEDTYSTAPSQAGPSHSRKQSSIPLSEPSVSRAHSLGPVGDEDAWMDDTDDLPLTPTLGGTSRFPRAIGRDTELTQGLAPDQPVNLFGAPVNPSANREEEIETANEPARNVRSYSTLCTSDSDAL